MEYIKGWKTVLFGLLVVTLPLLDELTKSDLLNRLIQDPTTAKLVVSCIGLVVILLRMVTNTPIYSNSTIRKLGD